MTSFWCLKRKKEPTAPFLTSLIIQFKKGVKCPKMGILFLSFYIQKCIYLFLGFFQVFLKISTLLLKFKYAKNGIFPLVFLKCFFNVSSKNIHSFPPLNQKTFLHFEGPLLPLKKIFFFWIICLGPPIKNFCKIEERKEKMCGNLIFSLISSHFWRKKN